MQRQLGNVGADYLGGNRFLEHGILRAQVFAAALDHGFGVVDGQNAVALLRQVTTHGLGRRAKRAAKIVDQRIGLRILPGNDANAFDNGRIAGYRALDHVRKNPRNGVVKGEIIDLAEGVGEQVVDLGHAGFPCG